MSKLDDFIARLRRQYLDPVQAACPQSALEEALRVSLERVNSCFGLRFSVEGLDGAQEHSLPDEFVSALLIGAGGALMRFVLQSHLSSYSNMGGAPELMQSQARYLDERFDWMLEGLRLDNLQESADLPFSRWEWEESLRWRS